MIHLVEGPVGAGKTTYAISLSRDLRAPVLNLDDWMVTLFRADRPQDDFMGWYVERKQRCLDQIWKVARDLLRCGSDAVLELGLVRQRDRQAFYALADAAQVGLRIYLLDAPEPVRRSRVRRRNREKGETFSMDVSDAMFELASGLWETPGPEELEARAIQCIDTTADGADVG